MQTSTLGGSRGRHYLVIAGALLFAAGIIAFMGIVTAEALYPPGYSASLNEISDLGATEPPDSVTTQPSATIFNVAMMVCGVLALAAAHCLQRAVRRWATPVPPVAQAPVRGLAHRVNWWVSFPGRRVLIMEIS